jgi:hypothetical protein
MSDIIMSMHVYHSIYFYGTLQAVTII